MSFGVAYAATNEECLITCAVGKERRMKASEGQCVLDCGLKDWPTLACALLEAGE